MKICVNLVENTQGSVLIKKKNTQGSVMLVKRSKQGEEIIERPKHVCFRFRYLRSWPLSFTIPAMEAVNDGPPI